MGHIANEEFDFHKQLQKLVKELNEKERIREGISNIKVIYGAVPRHFVERLFQRVVRSEINPVIKQFIQHIQTHKAEIKERATPIPVEYKVQVMKYIVCVEINMGGPCVSDPYGTSILVIPKTIIKED